MSDDGYGGDNRAWIFQANPLYYDIDKSVNEITEMTWFVKQYRTHIHTGDLAFLWKSGVPGGLVAIGTIISEPNLIKECPKMKVLIFIIRNSI